MWRGVWICYVLWASFSGCLADKSTCTADHSDCRCDFTTSADSRESLVAGPSTKSRAMAVALGAVAPLFLTGAGLGIWRLVVQCRQSGDSRPQSSAAGSQSGVGEDTAEDTAGDNKDSRPDSRPVSAASVTGSITLDNNAALGRATPISMFDLEVNPYLGSRFSTFIDPRGSPSLQYSRPKHNPDDINAWMHNSTETDA